MLPKRSQTALWGMSCCLVLSQTMHSDWNGFFSQFLVMCLCPLPQCGRWVCLKWCFRGVGESLNSGLRQRIALRGWALLWLVRDQVSPDTAPHQGLAPSWNLNSWSRQAALNKSQISTLGRIPSWSPVSAHSLPLTAPQRGKNYSEAPVRLWMLNRCCCFSPALRTFAPVLYVHTQRVHKITCGDAVVQSQSRTRKCFPDVEAKRG